MNGSESSAKPPRGRHWLVWVPTLAVVAAMLSFLPGTAGASPHVAAATDTPSKTCPTTYDGTVPCTPTPPPTTGFHLTLVISYTPGRTRGLVKWQACGYPAAALGTTVHLYLDGSNTGSSGPVRAGGCTSDPQFSVCLPAGTHPAAGEDQGYPSPTATLDVKTGGCAGVGANRGSSGSGQPRTTSVTSSSSSGALAFTGADILRDVLIALVAIGLGIFFVRLGRKRTNGGVR